MCVWKRATTDATALTRHSAAIIAVLVGVVALLALSPSLSPARGRSAQVFIFSDDQRPDTTTLLLNVVEALPLFQSYPDQRMTCDGVVYSYGEASWQTIVGYYSDVRARRPELPLRLPRLAR